MNNEEQVFDFMAAAEDTGRRLDALIKAIPNEIRKTLVAEYRKSPWLATLPTAADRMIAAAERSESASALLTRKTRIAGLLVGVAIVILPLSTWALAYWQTAKLREESAALQAEMEGLETAVSDLRNKTGGGIEVVSYKGGTFGVVLPDGMKFQHEARTKNNRNVLVYK